jgi:hypothetical protein
MKCDMHTQILLVNLKFNKLQSRFFFLSSFLHRPTIDIISPLKSPVKSASVAQDVDKPLKPKYKAKDFLKISSENKTGTKKSVHNHIKGAY